MMVGSFLEQSSQRVFSTLQSRKARRRSNLVVKSSRGEDILMGGFVWGVVCFSGSSVGEFAVGIDICWRQDQGTD